jgi:hypothetical protein
LGLYSLLFFYLSKFSYFTHSHCLWFSFFKIKRTDGKVAQVVRVPAYQAWSPKFKPQCCQKEKNKFSSKPSATKKERKCVTKTQVL